MLRAASEITSRRRGNLLLPLTTSPGDQQEYSHESVAVLEAYLIFILVTMRSFHMRMDV